MLEREDETMKSQQEVRAIVDALKELYPDGICSLDLCLIHI